MFLPERRGLAAAALLCLLASAAPLPAQTVDFEGQTANTLPPPQDALGRSRAQSLTAAGLQAQIAYVQTLSGKLVQTAPPQTPATGPAQPLLSGLPAVLAVLAAFALILLGWLMLGGRALLAADTTDPARKPGAAPFGWTQSATDLAQNRSLADIAAMADRSAALVRLLRLCLLAASQATTTGFRRADTERTAFHRLPAGWPGNAYLKTLLTAAELAHYGGRPVAEPDFHSLIAGAARILPGQGAGHA